MRLPCARGLAATVGLELAVEQGLHAVALGGGSAGNVKRYYKV